MRDGFDFFGQKLFDEAKAFYEKSKEKGLSADRVQCFLHASILLATCSLEAYTNAVSAEVSEQFEIDCFTRSVLMEKELRVENGVVVEVNAKRMSRIIDRIELIININPKSNRRKNAEWRSNLKTAISLRNSLVHPRETVKLTERQVENALWSILEAINMMYKSAYNQKVPIYRYGIMPKQVSL